MTFNESIEIYVLHKNAMGATFDAGKKCLRSLSQQIGSVELDRISSKHIETYLDTNDVSASTWRLKYYIFLHFFDFWAVRGAMPYLSFPPIKPKVRSTFTPYIFSKAEIKALVSVKNWKVKSSIDRITMRTFLLFLYATGAMAGEVWELSIEDLDLRRQLVTFRNKSVIRSRQIPLSRDLCELLKRYLVYRSKKNAVSSKLFVNTNGKPARYELALRCFRKLCKICDISRAKSFTYQPRLLDFKFTFAVHRITSWIRSKSDLNRMLPALAAYMGLKLGATEQYFSLTPERFSKHLKKLSPKGQRGHWRNDPELMAFLKGL